MSSELKIGPTYNFGAFDNKFIVIATTSDQAWVRWLDDSDTEIIDIKMDELVRLVD